MTSRLNIHQIEAFVAVAESGSMSRAATRLNLTQPAITRRIKNFEASFGEDALFDRSLKPAGLTSLGQHVLDHCKRALVAIAELEASTELGASPTGQIRVGVAHGLSELVLTSPLGSFRRSFPNVRMLVSADWTASLIQQIPAGEIDCGVGLLTQAHALNDNLRRLSLGRERIVVVSSSISSTKPDGSPWLLRNLEGEAWFLNPRGCGCRDAIERAFDRHNLHIRIAGEIFGESLQLSLVANSGGLGLVPYRQLDRSPHRNALRVLEVADFQLSAAITLLSSSTPGRFDAAINFLANELNSRISVEAEA